MNDVPYLADFGPNPTEPQLLDSRDIIERIEELEGEREALVEARDEAMAARDEMPPERGPDILSDAYRDAADAFSAADEELRDWDASDAAEELRILKALAEQRLAVSPVGGRIRPQAEPARVIAANGIGPGAGKGARAEATERELLRVSAFDLVRSGC